MSAIDRAESIYRRKYGESYPGEARDGAGDAIAEAVDKRTKELADKFADDPDAILDGLPDFDCNTVAVLVRHIRELRQHVPVGKLAKAIEKLRADLADARQIKNWAQDEIEREAA